MFNLSLFAACSCIILCHLSLVAAYETVSVDVSRPEDNSAFNISLAYYKLSGWNNDDPNLTHGFFPVGCGANLSVHYSEPSVYGNLTGTDQKPVLILTHGYPESSYIWRRTTQALSERVPLFVVDVSHILRRTGFAQGCPNFDRNVSATWLWPLNSMQNWNRQADCGWRNRRRCNSCLR